MRLMIFWKIVQNALHNLKRKRVSVIVERVNTARVQRANC